MLAVTTEKCCTSHLDKEDPPRSLMISFLMEQVGCGRGLPIIPAMDTVTQARNKVSAKRPAVFEETQAWSIFGLGTNLH
jgi:hypothetical protein